MPIFRFDERVGQRRINSNPPTYETQYVAAGIGNSGAVRTFALGAIPALVATNEGILVRKAVDVAEQGFELFHVTARYSTKEEEATRTLPAAGDWTFSFSTTGGTVHITHSLSTVDQYRIAGAPARNWFGGINVRTQGQRTEPEGADIIIPALKLTYKIRHPQGVLNEASARLLARNTAAVNDDEWHGFQPGELLLLGADGSDGSTSEAELSIHMAAEENLVGHVIGAIQGIEKQGHDLLWLWWEQETEPDGAAADRPAPKLIGCNVERMYRRISFAALLGF